MNTRTLIVIAAVLATALVVVPAVDAVNNPVPNGSNPQPAGQGGHGGNGGHNPVPNGANPQPKGN